MENNVSQANLSVIANHIKDVMHDAGFDMLEFDVMVSTAHEVKQLSPESKIAIGKQLLQYQVEIKSPLQLCFVKSVVNTLNTTASDTKEEMDYATPSELTIEPSVESITVAMQHIDDKTFELTLNNEEGERKVVSPKDFIVHFCKEALFIMNKNFRKEALSTMNKIELGGAVTEDDPKRLGFTSPFGDYFNPDSLDN